MMKSTKQFSKVLARRPRFLDGGSRVSAHLRLLTLILSAFLLTSCSQSVGLGSWNTTVLPPQPGAVASGGQVTKWPNNALAKDATPGLLAKVRRNELKQVRAVRACQAYHVKLQSLYGGK